MGGRGHTPVKMYYPEHIHVDVGGKINPRSVVLSLVFKEQLQSTGFIFFLILYQFIESAGNRVVFDLKPNWCNKRRVNVWRGDSVNIKF